jgi:hypothetical protein
MDTQELKAQLKTLIEGAERGLDAQLEIQILGEVSHLIEASFTARKNMLDQLGHLIRPATPPPIAPYPGDPQWDQFTGLPKYSQQN